MSSITSPAVRTMKPLLSPIRLGKHQLVEYELAKEQCSALGRAGKELAASIHDYYRDMDRGFVKLAPTMHLKRITEKALALMMTREYLGFSVENLHWIAKEYPLPAEVIESLSLNKPKGYLGRLEY